MEAAGETGRCYADGWEGGGRARNQGMQATFLEARRDKEMDCPPDPPRRNTALLTHFRLQTSRTIRE